MGWLPGWDSAESAGWWSHFHFWFGIVCLFLLGGSEVISHFYGLRKDELTIVAESEVTKRRETEQREKDARQQADTATLKHKLETTEKRAEELEQRQMPRLLTETQKTKMVAFLLDRPKGNLTIKVNLTVPDAEPYGREIGKLLQDQLGWVVRVDITIISGPSTKTIWIGVHDKEAITPRAIALFYAFKDASVPMQDILNLDPGPDPDEVWLSIGSKE